MDKPELLVELPVMNEAKMGAELIATERRRQIEKEGYSPEQDARWQQGELVDAASAYLGAAHACAYHADADKSRASLEDIRRYIWPWGRNYFKPSDALLPNLIKAGALIAAEIDRLQRKEAALPHHTELRGIFTKEESVASWCAMCGTYTNHQSGACPEIHQQH